MSRIECSIGVSSVRPWLRSTRYRMLSRLEERIDYWQTRYRIPIISAAYARDIPRRQSSPDAIWPPLRLPPGPVWAAYIPCIWACVAANDISRSMDVLFVSRMRWSLLPQAETIVYVPFPVQTSVKGRGMGRRIQSKRNGVHGRIAGRGRGRRG